MLQIWFRSRQSIQYSFGGCIHIFAAKTVIIGVSLSEPHIDEFAASFPLYVVP